MSQSSFIQYLLYHYCVLTDCGWNIYSYSYFSQSNILRNLHLLISRQIYSNQIAFCYSEAFHLNLSFKFKGQHLYIYIQHLYSSWSTAWPGIKQFVNLSKFTLLNQHTKTFLWLYNLSWPIGVFVKGINVRGQQNLTLTHNFHTVHIIYLFPSKNFKVKNILPMHAQFSTTWTTTYVNFFVKKKRLACSYKVFFYKNVFKTFVTLSLQLVVFLLKSLFKLFSTGMK